MNNNGPIFAVVTVVAIIGGIILVLGLGAAAFLFSGDAPQEPAPVKLGVSKSSLPPSTLIQEENPEELKEVPVVKENPDSKGGEEDNAPAPPIGEAKTDG